MTVKDFELIARVLNVYTSNPAVLKQWRDASSSIAETFADELALTNPRFDRARFLRACGVEV